MQSRSRRLRGCGKVGAAVLALMLSIGFRPPAEAAPQAQDGGQPRVTLPLPGAAPARPNEGTYLLRPTPSGGYMFDDTRFEAHVASDGQVVFKDKPLRVDIRIFGVPFRDYRRPNGRRLSLVEAIGQSLRPDPVEPLPAASVCAQGTDPRSALAASCRVPPPIAVTGNFDLTDEVMHLTGPGWNRSEKAKFLSATFELRTRLAAERYANVLQEAIDDLPSRLDALWLNPGYTTREKRRIVCLLWAEVNVDEAQTKRAEDVIISWIRRRIPAASGSAYTTPELTSCASHGRRSFRPYDVHTNQ